MATFDSVLGIHADALAVQQKRMAVLASNIANGDTPNYKARDIDFAKVLAGAQAGAAGDAAAGTLRTTDARHLGAAANPSTGGDLPLSYRVPLQPTVDGNTVDEQVEQAKFADAALHYQASLSFVNGSIKSLLTAITGQ
ncbi:MAG: flagellar basal body rod protein FlgB [Nevskia sp.]|nr:flagellar basal body rod protein FlgB [Nevskia sp.]